MKVSEFVGKVRDELFQGWTKNAYVRGQGNVCVVGAIERVALNTMDIQVAALAHEEIRKATSEIYGHVQVQSFNDAPNTRKQDVLDLLDKVTIGLEERGQ